MLLVECLLLLKLAMSWCFQITIDLFMSMEATKVTWQGARNSLKNPVLIIVTEGQSCKATS